MSDAKLARQSYTRRVQMSEKMLTKQILAAVLVEAKLFLASLLELDD